MATVCIPVTSVEGQGTCTFQPVQPVHGTTGQSGTIDVTIYPYVFTATPAQGWVFDRFVIDGEQVWTKGGSAYYRDRIGPLDITQTPFSLRDTITGRPSDWWEGGWIGIAIYDGDPSYYDTIYTEWYTIKAVFKHTPTHLLVNSFDRSTPVQLVYDPTTNLLVADY